MTKIILIEDDKNIARNLTHLLKREGYGVLCAYNKADAMKLLDENEFDLILLDISLPDGNGYAICNSINKEKDIPVIFLSASSDEMSVVTGLEMGADDYISKPFRPMELISRIKTVLRRKGSQTPEYKFGNIRIDTVKGCAYKCDEEIFLSALEYKILLLFLNNKGTIISRSNLLRDIWDVSGEYVNDNTLTVYIKRLREKIEDDPQNPAIIKTVRGIGYKTGD